MITEAEVNKDYVNAETLEQKLNLLIEQNDLLLKSIARLRQDFQAIVKDAINAVLYTRNKEAYARISS